MRSGSALPSSPLPSFLLLLQDRLESLQLPLGAPGLPFSLSQEASDSSRGSTASSSTGGSNASLLNEIAELKEASHAKKLEAAQARVLQKSLIGQASPMGQLAGAAQATAFLFHSCPGANATSVCFPESLHWTFTKRGPRSNAVIASATWMCSHGVQHSQKIQLPGLEQYDGGLCLDHLPGTRMAPDALCFPLLSFSCCLSSFSFPLDPPTLFRCSAAQKPARTTGGDGFRMQFPHKANDNEEALEWT